MSHTWVLSVTCTRSNAETVSDSADSAREAGEADSTRSTRAVGSARRRRLTACWTHVGALASSTSVIVGAAGDAETEDAVEARVTRVSATSCSHSSEAACVRVDSTRGATWGTPPSVSNHSSTLQSHACQEEERQITEREGAPRRLAHMCRRYTPIHDDCAHCIGVYLPWQRVYVRRECTHTHDQCLCGFYELHSARKSWRVL